MVAKLIAVLVLLTTALAEESSTLGYEKYKIDATKTTQTEVKQPRILVENDPQKTTTTETKLPTTTTASNLNVTDKEDMKTSSSQVYSTYSRPSYQVTENIIDIPDDRSPSGPIITNYTKKPQLNTVNPGINPTTEIPETTTNIKTKKNTFNLLHIKAEYDDKHETVETNNLNKVSSIFKGIKDSFSGLHKGLLNGIHYFFNKHDLHGEKFKRSADYQMEERKKNNDKSDSVDKTEYYVRRKHISLT
ncbi:uncharacterized protein LOC142981907 [Anticarsia gemmatalis]|uniref:uncharacterized protein LOC142981907 n=1 Tax=Anticarsia gemmatalis TaxID=129554 RepID=UPI003F764083